MISIVLMRLLVLYYDAIHKSLVLYLIPGWYNHYKIFFAIDDSK